MANKYFEILESSVTAYPSANSIDGGQYNSEYNISKISDKFTKKNFMVTDLPVESTTASSDQPFNIEVSGRSITISKGKCCIDGYFIQLTESTSADLSGDEFKSGTFSVYLQIFQTESGKLLLGPSRDLETSNMMKRGVRVVVASTDQAVDKETSLLLGQVTVSEGTITASLSDRKTRYTFIDSSTIVRVKEDGSLEEYNTYLQNEIIPPAVKDIAKDGLGDTLKLVGQSSTSRTTKVIMQPGPDKTESDSFEIVNELGLTEFSAPSLNDGLRGKIYIASDPGEDPSSKIIRLEIQNSNGEVVASFNLSKGTTSVSNRLTSAGLESSGDIKMSPGSKFIIGQDGSSTDVIVTDTSGGVKVYQAVWNDYADALKKDPSVEFEPGDVISKSEDSDFYTLSTTSNGRLVVGVYSDTYGHLLGGQGSSEEETLKTHVPVAVAGNVKVKVIGTVRPGDLLTVSDYPGVATTVKGRSSYVPGTVIGKALEYKTYTGVGKVLMQVMLM